MHPAARSTLLALLASLVAGPVLAADGVIELSQACATTTGCVSGDAPGFPITLDAADGRSYVLTSDLNVGDPDLDGIVLENTRITVDFNGFSLVGYPLGSGTGNGIAGSGTQGSGAPYATIRNGTIRGARSAGVRLGYAEGVRIENMVVELNAGGGVSVGDHSQVEGSRIHDNGVNGISTSKAVVRGNTVTVHAGVGIACLGDCVVERNMVYDSGLDGISSANNKGSVISENSVSQSGGYGINAGEGATVIGNTVSLNSAGGIRAQRGSRIVGNSAYFNPGTGIVAQDHCLLESNVVSRNFTGGMSLSASASYRNHTLNDNSGGPDVTGGVDMGGNSCNGTGTCP